MLFVLAACAGLLLLAGNPHGGEHLKDLLVGQILWVSTQQLIGMAALTAVVLALWFGLRERLGRAGFYLLFALAVTASVQLVGVYLVFTSLIVPALAVRSLRPAAAAAARLRHRRAGLPAGSGAVRALRSAVGGGGGAGDGGDCAGFPVACRSMGEAVTA